MSDEQQVNLLIIRHIHHEHSSKFFMAIFFQKKRHAVGVTTTSCVTHFFLFKKNIVGAFVTCYACHFSFQKSPRVGAVRGTFFLFKKILPYAPTTKAGKNRLATGEFPNVAARVQGRRAGHWSKSHDISHFEINFAE
jgi:hypothetical protein